MKTLRQSISSSGIKFSIYDDNSVVGRATLYMMRNDLHDRPFGLMEDVFVDKSIRKKGLGTTLVKKIIDEAKAQGCYKLIATSRYSRHKVHELYSRLGFDDHGKEFRMNFS